MVACGPKPPATWVESDQHQAHATPNTTGAATTAPVKVDLAKLTPAVIDELDEATCLAVIDQLAGKAPAAHVALRAARLAHHRGDDVAAKAAIDRASSTADLADVKAQLTALAGELIDVAVTPGVIAVLLPLSGRYGSVGAELRAAIELVPGVKWSFIDTRGEPDGATAAVDEAAKRGAIAILGPVGAKEVTAAARAAALRGIPIALLGPEDGADPAAGVFRLVGSPADEGRAVAALAKSQSFPTAAILAPRDDVGAEAANAFAEEAAHLGITIAARGTYDPTGGDVEPDIKQFLNLVPAKNPELAEHLRRAKTQKIGWETFTPDVEFSLLYIPDRYDRAAIVAAFLPYYNVELRTSEFPDPVMLRKKHAGKIPQIVQLVGGAGWHHPSLPLRGGTAVQGALLVDSYAGALGGDVAAQFAQDFQRRTGRDPSSAAAEAFDAATLLSGLKATTRDQMKSAIARGKLDDGACGPARMDVDGELYRQFTTLEVQGDELIVAP
ncbi:MAG: penicillin-binding protein activator [Kofleriaceae bacterium]